MKLNPAEYVFYVLGGVRATAKIVGRSANAVSLWNRPTNKQIKVKHPTRVIGSVPSVCSHIILQHASENGLDLTAADLMAGRTVSAAKVREAAKGDDRSWAAKKVGKA